MFSWSVRSALPLLGYWLRSRSISFTVSTQRPQVGRALFSEVKDNLELFRVDHYDVLKPLGMRLLGRCKVHLHSSDKEISSIYLYAIDVLEAMVETLRVVACANAHIVACCRWSRCSSGSRSLSRQPGRR